MNGADELSAEDVGEISRKRREAPAVHADDDAERSDEERDRSHMRERRRERIEHHAENEEAEVRNLPPHDVGERCPDKSAAAVEQERRLTKPPAIAAIMACCAGSRSPNRMPG